jgi:hypothetical protein
MMSEYERLNARSGRDFADGIAAGHRILQEPPKMGCLSFGASHITTVHEHVGALRKSIYSFAGDGVAADCNDFAFGFHSIAIANPTLQKSR